jgi:predicted ATPase
MTCRDMEQTARYVGLLDSIAREHRMAMWQAVALLMMAWLAMEEGRPQEAVNLYQRGFDAFSRTGGRLWSPYFKAIHSRALAACGYTEQAQALIAQAIADTGLTTQRWCEPELWRFQAELLLMGRRPDPELAERTFERAIRVARAQGSVLFELRAATSLARWWAEQGRRSEGARLLAPVFGRFAGQPQIPDLVEAQALLADLGGQSLRSR